MMKVSVYVCLLLILGLALSANADGTDRSMRTIGSATLTGGNLSTSKALRDTILLMGPHGSDALYYGDFEDGWNGDPTDPDNDWYSIDHTAQQESLWNIDTFNAANLNGHGEGNKALWCGFLYNACNADDPIGGYGNDWWQYIEFTETVADPMDSTEVLVEFYANWHMEPLGAGGAVYDEVDVVQWYVDPDSAQEYGARALQMSAFDDNVFQQVPMTWYAGEYVGDNADEIRIWVLVSTDFIGSDADCLYSVNGDGAIQLDDLRVTIDGVEHSFHDFEAGDDYLVDWTPGFSALAVGDFAMLRENLGDIDPCAFNHSWQATFVNDGQYIADGLEGRQGDTYRYGPAGYVTEWDGGLANSTWHLHNSVVSPIMAWPDAEMTGGFLRYDIWRHEENSTTSPGIFYRHYFRSTTSENPEDIQYSQWLDDNSLGYGPPSYFREYWDVSDSIEPGCTYVQCMLSAHELGYRTGIDGSDGTPAPYYDNVRLIVYPVSGPSVAGEAWDFANDNWPEIGTFDAVDLGQNSCRFDMVKTIAAGATGINDPGDSIVVTMTAVRPRSALTAKEMHYKIKTNPLFDPYRIAGFTAEGVVNGQTTEERGEYAFDLPDTGYLFPGDVLHYFFKAKDYAIGGGGTGETFLPADTTGYSNFTDMLAYSSVFTVRCLPTVNAEGDQPPVLFWNDFGNRGGENEWHFALKNLGILPGVDYDTYTTTKPDAGAGNGLGGRATDDLLSGYEIILYSGGDLNTNTIANGDPNNDISQDVQVLDNWFKQGDKSMFMTGDGVAWDLDKSGPETQTLLNGFCGLLFDTNDIRSAIQNQMTPLVVAVDNGDVFGTVDKWTAYGGCYAVNQFDGVTPNGSGARRLAEFANMAGLTGDYPFSAATLNVGTEYNSKVISMPYDFSYIYTPVDGPNDVIPARASVLNDVLIYFGLAFDPQDAIGVPDAGLKFSTRNYPNPFNPITDIQFTMPKTGHLTLKVYNVRGELVKTLVDGVREAGPGQVAWDGTSNQGAAVASGVYFYEARTNGEVRVNKMALVK